LKDIYIYYLPEDGRGKWPKYVAGYALYSVINLRICICIYLLFLIKNHERMVTNHLNLTKFHLNLFANFLGGGIREDRPNHL